MPISIPSSIKGISAQGISKGPLEVLYGIKNDKQILSYPRDLNTNPAKQHVIQFAIMKPAPVSNGGKTAGQVYEAGKEFINATGEALQSNNLQIPKTADDFRKIGGTMTQIGSEISNKVFDLAKSETIDKTLSTIGKTVTNQFTSKGVGRMVGETINLYIPDGLNVGYSSDYTTSSLRETLGTPYFFAQMAASIKETLNSVGGAANIGPNEITGNPFLRQLAAEKLPIIGSQGLAAQALAAEGYAVNPQLQVLFTGIGFRQFRFEFTLTPYSQEEAETIKKIVSIFKFAAAPTIQKSKYFDQGMFYVVPDPIRLTFLFGGRENTNIPKIEECVIKNVNVEYSPMGWATFADGNPVQTKLSLELEETVLIDKNKIKEGY